MTSKDFYNATGLPELVAGPSPSSGLVGAAPSGLGVVPVSRFRARAYKRETQTPDTFGPLFTGLSKSDALQSSLENKLRQILGANGSPLYALTWRTWDMPAQGPICALRALAHPTSGKGFSGWPSPNVREKGGCEYADPVKAAKRMTQGHQVNLADVALLAGWPTRCWRPRYAA